MPVVISGTNGVSGVDGTASNPSYEGTDSNTGIFFPAADTIAFAEGGTEVARFDSSGNFGIGTSSLSQKLDVVGTAAFTYINSTGQGTSGVYFAGNSGSSSVTQFGGELRFSTGGTANTPATSATERMRIDSSGNVGIGTASPTKRLQVESGSTATGGQAWSHSSGTVYARIGVVNPGVDNNTAFGAVTNNALVLLTNNAERARIDESGNLLVGKTTANVLATNGIELRATDDVLITTDGATSLYINRNTNDGELVQFRQANTTEGNISVSGTTVSYNGGHLSRYAQTTTAKDESLVKGTVLSNLDEMNVYTDAEGNPVDNEQLNKVKVSDIEGDANVAGVFVNWTHDDAHDVDEINMAMTGDMIIRIAQGVTVARGDLLMSAGDGTAKPQGDDIIRSKTVAKVTSTHVTCTYADGSYCVPCVLMAC